MESGDSVTRDAMGKEVRRTVKRNGRYITVYPVGISDTGFVKYANGGIVPLSTAEVSSEPDPYVLHVDDCPVATWKEAVEAPREALGSLRMPDWGNYLPTATSLAQAKGPDDACKAVGIDKAERYEGMDPAPTRVREDPFIGDNRS